MKLMKTEVYQVVDTFENEVDAACRENSYFDCRVLMPLKMRVDAANDLLQY